MKIALVDSGIGLLAAATAVRRLRPDADLILSSDPDGMPWGPRRAPDLQRRVLATAQAAAALQPDALIIACNTATVHALHAVKAALEPTIPVIGTVPAVKTAAATGGPIAIWATPATTGSSYQAALICEHAPGVQVTEIACPGLADAVQHADLPAMLAAVTDASRRTPDGTTDVVLGCTHYELVAGHIRTALRRPSLITPILRGSADAVAAQALRRLTGRPGATRAGHGRLTVLLSGRESQLPAAALAYRAGQHVTASFAA
ncbi:MULTISPECIES: glutamate racemase [unclassified Streptomyces]|uniref:glutamate racemase n=1 Tax=unclassified Streptomyces TaxID=2593676 RepID=UPI00226FC3F8|nr:MULTISPECIES: aspartate/glutamate racemase family protein [unclassified Streptomyces]MCY0922166.1 aspartate/glutamate racemase family protein [Streptomyces sp. H27-G5]MCY0963316.1 aspartate/glutamate racemase family protein [Streptomyces sp. H27-H5]